MKTELKRKTIHHISFDNLSFCYDPEYPVFDRLTVELPIGRVVRLQGRTGSGKSAFLKILAGLLHPQRGQYYVNHEAVSEMSFEEFLTYRLNIGYSFDLGGLLNNRTIKENLLLPLQYHKLVEPDEVQRRVSFLMERFALDGVAQSRPSAISGGKRKAAVVARAFVMNPEVLLMDDPTTGLSTELKRCLVQTLKEFRDQGYLKHVFLVSEDQEFLRYLEEQNLQVVELSLEQQGVMAS